MPSSNAKFAFFILLIFKIFWTLKGMTIKPKKNLKSIKATNSVIKKASIKKDKDISTLQPNHSISILPPLLENHIATVLMEAIRIIRVNILINFSVLTLQLFLQVSFLLQCLHFVLLLPQPTMHLMGLSLQLEPMIFHL